MHKKTLFSRAGRLAVAVSGALALAGAALPANASTLRIAMTAADIPLTLGQPDQGYEGNRFTGIPLYDALVEWDLSQGEKPSGLVPGLATEWHIDPQNTSRWIFTLRPGVKFHDGTEVNADAIVWNVDKVLNKAAPQYAPGQIGNTLSRMPTLTGAEKIDDHTVALTTSEPDALLPYNITNLFIVSPTAWQKQYDAVPASVRDSAARSKQAWTAFAAHAVGSGPFKLEKLVPRQQLILAKNPDYWNKDRIPRVDKVVLIPLPEANARTAALVHRLPQDVAWARNRSATSPTPYRIVLGPGCQWQTQQASFAGGTLAWNSTAETDARSMPAATAAAAHPQATCSLSGGATQHVTFDGQGLIADNAPTVTIASGNGQTWTLQILLSGLVLLNAQTSS